MSLYIDDGIVKPDIAFTLYFSLMFCFYTMTYVQLVIQIGILMYVLIAMINSGMRIKKYILSNLRLYMLWFGLFTLMVYLSKFWAYKNLPDSRNILTTFRIFSIGTAMFFYINSKKRAFSVFEAFIIGCFIMSIVVYAVSWRDIGTTDFGLPIGQHRNSIGAVGAPLTVICMYLYKNFNMKYGMFLSAYFAVLTVCTGSRSSILQIAIIIALYIFFEREKISKKVISICGLAAAFAVLVVIFQKVPFLYETVWVRMENAVSTVTGQEIADGSALSRNNFREVAYNMFKQRPWLGFGVDGFKAYVADHPYFKNMHLESLYSHCNYAELASCFGVLGLSIWYIPIVGFVIGMFKYRKINSWNVCLLSVFLSMILLDYSRIPWTTHIMMYLFFIVILLHRFERVCMHEK